MTTLDLYGLVGQVLDGQFRVERVIGEGGFSVVYRGTHVGLDEPVAIKCLKLPSQLGSALVEGFIRRFRDESKIHYRLSRGSLHIARTIAAGTTMAPAIGALVPYMVLEWLEGYTLAEELRARAERGETGRSAQAVLRLLDPVADAMAFAHSQGVVHRDLNPSNIFVAHENGGSKLKVLDFGVAKVISDHALSLGPRAVTIGQIRMFTPAYAAPEQFHEEIGPIGPQTDVYSFAVLVVELLADRTPVEGEHIGDYADRARDPERRPTPRAMGIAVGDAVEAVIARAVSVDPSQRPRDIGEFWGMLKNAASQDAMAPSDPPAAAVEAKAEVLPAENRSAPTSSTRPAMTERLGGSSAARRYGAFANQRKGTASPRPTADSDDSARPAVTEPGGHGEVRASAERKEPDDERRVADRKATLIGGSMASASTAQAQPAAPAVNVSHEDPIKQVPSEPRAGTVGPTVARVIDVGAAPEEVENAAPPRAPGARFPGDGRRGARMPGAAIPEAERPRWHAPSSPQQPELFLPSLPPPRSGKRNIQVLVAIAVGLTVTFVAVAIVATELAR